MRGLTRAWGRLGAAAMGVIAAAALFAGRGEAAPAMWLVKDADSEIYLFGSMHVLQPGLKWRTPAYEAAWRRADTVWFEADMVSEAPGVRRLIERYGVDRERTLSQKLLPTEVAALGPLLARQRMDLAKVDHLRPWVTALTLSVTPMLDRGYKADTGVDTAVAKATHASPKRLRTFESLERQAQMFAAMPEPVELQYLADVIRERTTPSPAAPMQKAWMDGDLAALGEGLIGVMKTTRPQFYDLFLKDRNHAWAEALGAEMVGGRGVQLVNVGALHMLGDDGLPALMRAKGYSVTRIQ